MKQGNKKVLVTGSDGFIGSHLVEELVHSGYSVKAFCLYNSFNSWGWLDSVDPKILDQVEIVTGDVRDYHCVKEALADCSAVLHLAALIAIPYSYSAPRSYVDTNITGTLNILQASKELNIQKVITTSTSEVYGSAQSVPISEKHPLSAQSPYAATKIAADQLSLSFHKSFDLQVGVLRPFNTYGPRQSLRAVIPSIITQIAAGKEEIELGSLTPTRDFTYVKDTARGFIQALESKEIVGKVLNIGSSFEVSIGSTVDVICEAMGKDIKIISSDDRMRPEKSEVSRLFADTSMATSLMGWSPSFGGLEGFKKGIKETSQWFSQPENLKNYKYNLYNI